MPTIESILRVQDHFGNRDNKLRARLKWLVDTMGIDELRARILKERKFLPASATYPRGVPAEVTLPGRAVVQPARKGDAGRGAIATQLPAPDGTTRYRLERGGAATFAVSE